MIGFWNDEEDAALRIHVTSCNWRVSGQEHPSKVATAKPGSLTPRAKPVIIAMLARRGNRTCIS
jgi:hypothetical protein